MMILQPGPTGLLSDQVPLTVADFDPQEPHFEALEETGIVVPEWLKSVASKRAAEFITGRLCALKSLERLGYRGPPPLESNEDRSPVWPKGYCGSIAHTHAYACAGAARLHETRAVGLDCERVLSERQFNSVQKVALIESERVLLREAGTRPLVTATLIFSAKETLYKALRPMTGSFFGFDSAETLQVHWSTETTGTLRLALTKALTQDFPGETEFQLSFLIQGDKILTALELPSLGK